MLQRLSLWIVVAGLLSLQTVHARERILSFHSDIEVLADSSMIVTETIRVVAEGQQIKRGIYRDFPTDYLDRWNNRIQVDFEVDGVTRDGLTERFFTEKYANGVKVYAGSSDRFLTPGEYEYAITYRTNRQLGYFDDHDELYWNVTGNGWGFSIERASATIRLPAGVPKTSMAIEGYTGPFGSKGQDYKAFIADDSEARIAATRQLPANHGLTVVVSWPKGVVVEPTAADRAGYLLKDNRGLLIALSGLGLMVFYLYFVWNRYGRDPGAGPVFPHYDPPPELSPGACRYIQKMSHDHQAFSAAVLNLAAKGYVTIHEGRTEALAAAIDESPYYDALDQLRNSMGEEGSISNKLMGALADLSEKALEAAHDDTFVLEKYTAVAGRPELGPGEQTLLKKLFGKDQFLMLSNTNHEIVSKAIKAHDAALKKYYQKANFATNGGLILPAVLIGLVAFVLAGITGELTPLTIGVMIAALPLVVWFTYLMKAPTVKGRKTMDAIEGFKMYLTVAEAEDLKRVESITGQSPQKTPELFERLLPYAVALDVEQPWADQFETLFMKISAERGQSYRPTWYNGNKPVKSFSRFTTDMTSALGSAISSSSSPPGSSSGGGGGGSSGGGGGGGGGGGW